MSVAPLNSPCKREVHTPIIYPHPLIHWKSIVPYLARNGAAIFKRCSPLFLFLPIACVHKRTSDFEVRLARSLLFPATHLTHSKSPPRIVLPKHLNMYIVHTWPLMTYSMWGPRDAILLPFKDYNCVEVWIVFGKVWQPKDTAVPDNKVKLWDMWGCPSRLVTKAPPLQKWGRRGLEEAGEKYY